MVLFYYRPEDIRREILKNVEPYNSTSDISDNITNVEAFDSAVGNVLNIIVSYDMGWSKRDNGRSYDSLNGYGAMIRFLSGKVLDFRTRNRKCKRCDLGHPKESHDCRLYFKGSAKATEADVGADLLNRSEILAAKGLCAKVFIGDEDSSTIAAIRRDCTDTVYKLADKNHLNKHFTTDLYNLQAKFAEMRKKDVIPHLKKCFSYAVAQNYGKPSNLEKILKVIPDHDYGYHGNCGKLCHRDNTDNQKHTKNFIKRSWLVVCSKGNFQ